MGGRVRVIVKSRMVEADDASELPVAAAYLAYLTVPLKSSGLWSYLT